MTRIDSNGSKWAGEEPDTLEKLIEVLAENTLDPTFEDYGNFVQLPTVEGDNVTQFFGNFAGLSHVFSIDSDEPETIARLTKAIRDNQATPEYKQIRKGNIWKLTKPTGAE